MTAPVSQYVRRAARQHTDNIARFMKLKHLTNSEAAKELGLTAEYVRQYRRQNPEISYTGHKTARTAHVAPKPYEDHAEAITLSRGTKKRVYVARAGMTGFADADSRAVRNVSLPREPWVAA